MRLQAHPYAFYVSCLKAGREITDSDRLTNFPVWCPLLEKEESK